VYGYPLEDAARVALTTVKAYLEEHPEIERVRFVLFGQATLQVFTEVWQKIRGG
jgi:O-acetyl-ADP-ribose deacetylase (regulator of RNase III)